MWLLGFYHSVHPGRSPGPPAIRGRVRGLVLFGGALRGWDPMRGSGTQALLSLIERDWDTFVESIGACLARLADRRGRATGGGLVPHRDDAGDGPRDAPGRRRHRRQMDASLVTAPVLVLHRADASVIPFEVSAELARALPAGRLEVLPGSNASLFFEDADRCRGTARRRSCATRSRGR